MTIYFTEDHEWVKVDGNGSTMGITTHAAEQLGEIVFVELKEVGDSVEKGDEIVEANDAVVQTPTAINDNPEGDAWLYKIKLSDASELDGLMDANAYKPIIG